MAVTNLNGLAATSHSNRCISLIEMGSMKRVSQINGLSRTVWTLAFHPMYMDLLATGDLGGRVCVFKDGVNLDCFFFVVFTHQIPIDIAIKPHSFNISKKRNCFKPN